MKEAVAGVVLFLFFSLNAQNSLDERDPGDPSVSDTRSAQYPDLPAVPFQALAAGSGAGTTPYAARHPCTIPEIRFV